MFIRVMNQLIEISDHYSVFMWIETTVRVGWDIAHARYLRLRVATSWVRLNTHSVFVAHCTSWMEHGTYSLFKSGKGATDAQLLKVVQPDTRVS